MKKLIVFLMAVGFIVAGSGLAQALDWQTTPILGFSTEDTGNVIVNTRSGVVTIPHVSIVGDPLYGIGLPSMDLFYVGETVDAGSGIYYVHEGDTYRVDETYVGPTRTVSYTPYDYIGSSGEGFVMWYNDPVSTLTLADVGTWHYTQSWTNTSTTDESPISYETDFEVRGVPEPATMLLLGLGLVGLAGIRRKFRS